MPLIEVTYGAAVREEALRRPGELLPRRGRLDPELRL